MKAYSLTTVSKLKNSGPSSGDAPVTSVPGVPVLPLGTAQLNLLQSFKYQTNLIVPQEKDLHWKRAVLKGEE